jgi:hypothetical protein
MSVVKISVGSTKIVVERNGKVIVSSGGKIVFNKKGEKPRPNIVSIPKKSKTQYRPINVLETSLDDLIALKSSKYETDIYDGSYDKFPFYPSNNTYQGKVQTEDEYIIRCR